MAIGSPKGAMLSSITVSPGTQPISSNLRQVVLSVNDSIIAVWPVFKSAKVSDINMESLGYITKLTIFNRFLIPKKGYFRAVEVQINNLKIGAYLPYY